MGIDLDIDTWDVDHYYNGGFVKLDHLIDQLFEHLNLDIVDGKVVCKEEKEDKNESVEKG